MSSCNTEYTTHIMYWIISVPFEGEKKLTQEQSCIYPTKFQSLSLSLSLSPALSISLSLSHSLSHSLSLSLFLSLFLSHYGKRGA